MTRIQNQQTFWSIIFEQVLEEEKKNVQRENKKSLEYLIVIEMSYILKLIHPVEDKFTGVIVDSIQQMKQKNGI